MEKIKLYARAKINPILDVVGKLENGYHSLQMVMQTINLIDTIYIRKTFNNNINLETNIYWLPTDEKNLVYKVAEYLKNEYNIKYGIDIKLIKKIPICAGLAGGSTDCAATLIGIRNLFNLPISNKELLKIGQDFGADVPFCIKRGTYLAEGIGEKLTPLKPFPHCHILIAKPHVSISTASIFQSMDLANINNRPDIEKFIYYLNKQDLEGISKNLCNVLEEVSIKKYPIIADIKENMIKNGALGSLMSGSGSAVFGIFKDKRQAIIAKRSLEKTMRIREVFVTRPFNFNI
ncbi:4-(cytidine 5'-diphospho)-2-C-methyl-D-erythritol kinase [[Clostridium] colinum]|uniref:4-(cytidine 5'-diphospho)-2-C-methyl-D-erythritol kinase n=1 Tax=[Clostridium] colinum TaxID=36835 RepID=UPI002024D515|nr:4-(cytidine 5'-diphospho)-2-C-methyl-D-erythritol kinase [[Clostridium] colinum]